MPLRNTTTQYGAIARFFHWLIFVLVLGMLIFGYSLDLISKADKPLAVNSHKLIGLAILCLMLLRLAWALANPKPYLPAKKWEHFAERTVHLLLYVTVIAMPVAGWIASSAANKPPHLDNYTLRLPVPQSKPWIEVAFTAHQWLAIAIIVLVSIHALAAFYHHFIKHDNVLRRMLP